MRDLLSSSSGLVLAAGLALGACQSGESAGPVGVDSSAPGDDTTVETPETGVEGDTHLPEIGVPESSLPPQPIGGVCQQDAECQSGYCNTHPPGGYCSLHCDAETACPDDATCLPYVDSDGVKRSLCLKPCTTNASCRTDQFCPNEVKLCTPRCEIGGCNAGYECNLSTGRCVIAAPCEPVAETCDGLDQDCNGYIDEGCGPGVPHPSHVKVLELGKIQLGGGGLSRSFRITPDQGASSLTLIIVGQNHPETYLQLYGLTAPGGVDLSGGGDPYAALNPTFPSYSPFTAQIPNTDAAQLEVGSYGFSIYAIPENRSADAPIDDGWVYVLQNMRQAPDLQGKLDVNYWFVGIPGLDSQIAQTNPRFQSLIASFQQVLTNAGIAIGTSRYFDVTGADADRFTICDTTSDLATDEEAALLSLSRTLPESNMGVSFFFVQGFSGWELLGKAGGIPGPPLMHGTPNSGVVVSMAEYTDNPNANIGLLVTAETMAHELGHQIGLFHTTESDGRHFDPIGDTPECPAENDKNHDGMVDPGECGVKGATNLMFWAASLETQLSVGQRTVLHKNPTLRD